MPAPSRPSPSRLRRSTAAAAAVVAGIAAPAARAAEDPRPNFLIIISDDQSWFDVGAYGNDVVQTPNIDRLAAEGMLFERAFTPVPMCAPSRSALMTGLYPVRNGAWPNHAAIYPDVRTLPQALQEEGYRAALAGKTHLKPVEQFPFEYLPENAGPSFLASVDEDEPFVFVLATKAPHFPWPRPVHFDPDEIDLPPFLADTQRTRFDRASYYQEIRQMDALVGQTLDALDAEGLADETIVIFAGDQGASFPFEKWCLYDGGTRVPFIVRWPGEVPAASRTDAMVSFVDVLPTLLDIAGAAPDHGLDGASFLPVLRQQTSEHHDAVFGIQTSRGIIEGPSAYPIRSVRTNRHKYIRNLAPQHTFQNMITDPSPRQIWISWQQVAPTDAFAAERLRLYQHRPAEELYDLQADPWEMNNLAASPAHQAVKAQLSARLDAWMEQQGDEGLATEMMAEERQNPGAVSPVWPDYVIEEEAGGRVGPTDRSVTRTGSLGSSAEGQQGRNSVFVLEIPPLDGQSVREASLSFEAASPINLANITYNADLYAIGIVEGGDDGVSTDQLLPEYHEGASDPANALIQAGILTPANPQGRIETDAAGQARLARYLQDFYDDRPGYDGGWYVLLRVSPDADPGSRDAGYRPLPVENGGRDNDPLLTVSGACPGDVDGDGDADVTDLLGYLRSFRAGC